MAKVLEYPPIPVSDLLRRIRDDLGNIYMRDNLEILKATVHIQNNKKVSGAMALQELGTLMYNLGKEIES